MLDESVGCLCTIFTGWRAAAGRTPREQQEFLGSYKRELLAAFRQHKVRTSKEISRGLAVARQQDTDYLPNPGRFARWCKEQRAPYHHPAKLLDQLPTDRDTGLAEIRKLRERRASA